MKNFSSSQFTWKGNRGVAEISELLGIRSPRLSRFTITSERTGQIRTYEIDSNDSGYEDGWDGEYTVYTDNLWDGTRVTIIND